MSNNNYRDFNKCLRTGSKFETFAIQFSIEVEKLPRNLRSPIAQTLWQAQQSLLGKGSCYRDWYRSPVSPATLDRIDADITSWYTGQMLLRVRICNWRKALFAIECMFTDSWWKSLCKGIENLADLVATHDDEIAAGVVIWWMFLVTSLDRVTRYLPGSSNIRSLFGSFDKEAIDELL